MLRTILANNHEHGCEGLRFEVLNYDMTKIEKGNTRNKSQIDRKVDDQAVLRVGNGTGSSVEEMCGFVFNFLV